MRRYLLLALLILSMASLMAVESAPSATVGYFRKSIAAGSVSAFSQPFFDADMSVPTRLGDQFGDLDALTDINSGTGTEYYAGWGWYGDLENLEAGIAYWISREASNPALNFYLTGTVNPQPVSFVIPAGGVYAFGLNEARDIAISALVIPGVYDLDAITDIGSGTGTEYYEGWGWYGDLEWIEPSNAYWYSTQSPTPISWGYTPGGRTTAPDARTKTPSSN